MYKKLKNKKIKIIFGLILLITLNFTSLSFINKPFNKSTNNLNELKSSGVSYDIEINDLPGSLTNWSWAATQPWFGGGSGTELHPYIIEDETFMYSSGMGECLRIFHSKKHFIVRNCTIINSNPALAGLHLNNVTNGQIFDNDIVFNGYGIVYIDVNNTFISNNNISIYSNYGVWLLGDSDNNIITGNTINGNGGNYGIDVYIDADNNQIYDNYVTNHAINNANDDGANNDWNNTVIGNYWDDYTGYDMDLDGIGDDPYSITGSAGNFDFLPIWNIQGPIAIDDLPSSLNNWTWAATQPWFGGGSGTELDPYIIENLNIDGGGTGNCLSIENSIKHFTIQECTFINSGSSMTDAGVYLSNVTNAVIIENNCSNNYNGIYFEYSHDNDFSSNTVINNPYIGIWGQYTNDNNTFYDNFITNSHWGLAIQYGDNNIIQNNIITDIIADGILLYGSGNNCIIDSNYVNNCNLDGIRIDSFDNCIVSRNTIIDSANYGLNLFAADNNLVFENYFINNTDNAFDNGANNDWNNTVIGNYWDDYTGYDMNLDGIGDTPYDVPPPSGSQDYLPIWNIQAPIAIDDFPGSLNNWTWAASQAWCSGSGTELDPYIIEDMNIDANLIDSCISILNSEVYFKIQGCTLNNSVDTGTDAGVYLYNVTNGNIIGNNFYNNRYAAIYGVLSDHNTISSNSLDNNYFGIIIEGSYNKVLNNTIYGDTMASGILIRGSINNNNTVNGNIIENCWQGIWIYGATNTTLSGNEASNNLQNGIIILQYSYFTFLSGNIIVNNALSGIYITWSFENTIESNFASDNIQHGIYLLGSDDNIIYDNVISENIDTGVYIDGSSDGSLIYRNFFGGNGIHAFDAGSNNDWNSTTIGNYWDNHTSPDLSPIDGIVDNPYTYIGGSAGSIDYLPIAEDGPPSIIINSPSEDDVFGTSAPSFSVTITDDFLDETWYTLDGGLHNYTFTGSTGTIDQSAWDVMPDGTITLTFYASDHPGNISSAEVNIEKDSQAPIIVINSPFEDDVFGTSAPSFNVTITDNFLDKQWYTLDGGLHNYAFTGSTGTINQSAWDAMPDGTITLTFYASDIPGNISSAEVNIEKNSQAPIIVIISPHTDDTFDADAPSFIVEISDDNLDTMWYSLDGGLTNFFFTANGTIDQTAWAALSEGSVTITFYANNTLGNLASESVNVEKALPAPGDNFIIIIIIISIVTGATIITVVTVILLKKRKAGE